MNIEFQVVGIPKENIRRLIDQDRTGQTHSGIRKMIVDRKPGYPCRVSLADAEIGEEVLLLTYDHHQTDSPYRASGPVFIRPGAAEVHLPKNELPVMLHHRFLSLRVYDRAGMMIHARTLEGKFLATAVQEIFAEAAAAYIQVHNAGPGCFNCQIDRVS